MDVFDDLEVMLVVEDEVELLEMHELYVATILTDDAEYAVSEEVEEVELLAVLIQVDPQLFDYELMVDENDDIGVLQVVKPELRLLIIDEVEVDIQMLLIMVVSELYLYVIVVIEPVDLLLLLEGNVVIYVMVTVSINLLAVEHL